jgi:hypothetical protein
MGTLTIGLTPKTNNPQPLHAQRNRQMKRSSSDAGLPPTPRQLQIPAIPIFNPFAIQPPPPPAPLPPTMTTVQRPAIAAWPQPNPAFYPFAANQAYPTRPSGLPVSTAAPHGMRLATRPQTTNLLSTAPSGSSGRYTPSQLAGKTEAIVKLATPADLSELAGTLQRRDNTVTKITLIARGPGELKATFDAICTSMSILDLEICYEGTMPAPEVLNQLFSTLQERNAPLKSFRWVSTQPNARPLAIDQKIFESLFALPLMERVHFSGSPGRLLTSVIDNNADRLTQCVEKHRSLKSLSLERIVAPSLINAILKGAANNSIIEEIHLKGINLKNCSTALQETMENNKKLRSVSMQGCELKFGVMTQVLKSIQEHPTLVSLDFTAAKIPNAELQVIGEPIGELLVANRQIKSLSFGCTLSPNNIAAITIGLDANTSLSFLSMTLEEDPTYLPDLEKTNTTHPIRDMFRSNKGLQEIAIRLPSSENGSDFPILEGVAQSPSIETLTIENLANLDGIIAFITHNERIKHLDLKMQAISTANSTWIAQSMCRLAEGLSENKGLLNFSFHLHPQDEKERMTFYGTDHFSDLKDAIRRVDDVATRNQIRRMAPLAGAAMSRRQDKLSHVPGALPTLPAEINQLLFEATIDYMSPNDAQTLYDTVLPFTPLPRNQ